jgi:multidrug efflux pump subunit AcrA (membrane-fusion protein)
VTDYRIVSPLTGIVSSVKVKPGEMATSGTTGFSQEGALLMEISDQRQLEVVVHINEIDIPKIRPGMPAKVTLAARPGSPMDAVVDRVAVAPLVTTATGPDAGKVIVYPVSLRLPERPPELRQGMTATVDLTLDERGTVVRIPVLAFAEKEGKSLVRVGKGTVFSDREVTLGLKSDRFVEVTSGLKPGDVIAARYPAEEKGGRGGR